MNYRVVLADDEPEVLRSIQRTLDWEKYGFSVVGAFLNGLDVLEFLENHDVDIVFTDIRMPFMDGIELMHKIKEKYPYIKLVIISGYDDFQYAKEALIHGVLDYILKPINAREMSEVLQKVKDKMDTELEEKQSIQKLRNLYLENQPIIRENFLNRLVVGNIKAKALQEEKKTGLIRMGEYKYWATALAQIYQIEQKDHGETMDSQLASIYIRNLIRNSISDDIYYEAFYNPLGECILFGMNEPEEMEKILLKLNDIAKESKRVMKIKAAIGVGKIKDELIKVKESFEEAKEALSYRKMSQDGDVIYMEDIDKSEQVILLFDEKAQDKRKSELDSLQAQITPHFLYNTLDIVVWMIEENRKEDAAGMVTALARFLRISLSKGKNIITVADELEHARNYLMIQSLRAKDQFTYRIEKDPGTECFQVIKLIVQPIVENALYHGLEGMYGDGEIVIHAYTKDGDLYISVKDNGMGMSKEQAEALLDYTKELKTAKGNGIGVRNVHERIQLHFGKEYGVQIISEEDEGTEILLHLPAIMYGEKKE